MITYEEARRVYGRAELPESLKIGECFLRTKLRDRDVRASPPARWFLIILEGLELCRFSEYSQSSDVILVD